jgi:predicted TIM-barrel fold metal-dependent hydrolase
MTPQTDQVPLHDANRLGLDYRHEARRLPHAGPIWDMHTHLGDEAGARAFFEVADTFGIERVWSMTQLEQVDAIREALGDRVHFIAVPNYIEKEKPGTFTTDFLRRIEGFAEKGCRMVKFWAAPRGRDLDHPLLLDTPSNREAMRLARSLGMAFMTHVGDPDTWFATVYKDASRYGTKAQQYEPLERLLDDFGDVPWIAAHLAGSPEDLDHVQRLLDRHANLYVDTSATKWMVRELSRHPQRFADFCRANPARVLFGSDIVANQGNVSFDLYASRYWALRTLFETDYRGPSPIVDPDLSLVDPTLPPGATAAMRGCLMDDDLLAQLYHGAASAFVQRTGV